MFYAVADGHGLPHNPFKAIVAPRPIAWISTRSPAGVDNLAPYSFFNAVSDQPPMVMFSSGGRKDTARHAEASGEFAVSLVSRALIDAMNQTSAVYDAAQSEFAAAQIRSEPCKLISCLRPAHAPATLECKVADIIQPKSASGAQTPNIVVFGEVIGVHLEDAHVIDGRFDAVAAGVMSRLGYMDYSGVTSSFTLNRPTKP